VEKGTKETKKGEIMETIHDGNIYYNVPCKNNCGIQWLTTDEIEIDNGYCSNCETKEEKK
jgi:hypothetical protein